MSTVIDQFIIKVKLDTSEYEAGQKKLDKATQETKQRAKEAGNAFGDAAEAGAKRATSSFGVMGSMLGKGGVIGLAIGSLIYAGKILDDKLFEVARGVRQVGIDSKNFNIAAANLRNLQNASEMAGGSMEDANKTVGGLAGSLYNLKFNGAVDDSLIALGRLGVHFTDSYGRAKEFNAVMLETADAIDKAKASGKMSDSEAYFFAGQAGFTGGMQNLVTSGRSNVESEIARQAARKQIGSDTLIGSTDWVRGSTSLGQGVVSEGGLRGVNAISEKRAEADALLEKSGKATAEWMSGLSDKVKEFSTSISEATKRVGDFFNSQRASSFTSDPQKYDGDILSASKKYGIPAEVISGLLRTESGFNPDATNPSGAKGIAQLMPATGKMLGVTPGLDPSADIDAATHYLSILRKQGTNNGLNSDMSLAYAVDAYHTGAGNLASGKNIGPESMGYAGKVLSGTAYANTERPWMSGQSSNVNIDQINIHTQATDANGIASEISGALTRQKMLTAQAERGAQ